MSTVGVNLKTGSKWGGGLSRPILMAIKDVKDPVSEPVKVSVTVSVSFKHLNFVVASLGKSVGVILIAI